MASKVAAAHDRDPADLVGLISDHAGETGAEAALALASLTGSDSGCEAAEEAGAVPALLAYGPCKRAHARARACRERACVRDVRVCLRVNAHVRVCDARCVRVRLYVVRVRAYV